MTLKISYNRQRFPWRGKTTFNQQSFKRKTRRTGRCVINEFGEMV